MKRRKKMPRETQAEKIQRLQAELDEANERVENLEIERLDALEALGVEIIDDDQDPDRLTSEINIIYGACKMALNYLEDGAHFSAAETLRRAIDNHESQI